MSSFELRLEQQDAQVQTGEQWVGFSIAGKDLRVTVGCNLNMDGEPPPTLFSGAHFQLLVEFHCLRGCFIWDTERLSHQTQITSVGLPLCLLIFIISFGLAELWWQKPQYGRQHIPTEVFFFQPSYATPPPHQKKPQPTHSLNQDRRSLHTMGFAGRSASIGCVILSHSLLTQLCWQNFVE